jgi:hypothetical protein
MGYVSGDYITSFIVMDSDKIKSWEVLLADAIGEDAAMRILYDAAARPFRWISGRAEQSGTAPQACRTNPQACLTKKKR